MEKDGRKEAWNWQRTFGTIPGRIPVQLRDIRDGISTADHPSTNRKRIPVGNRGQLNENNRRGSQFVEHSGTVPAASELDARWQENRGSDPANASRKCCTIRAAFFSWRGGKMDNWTGMDLGRYHILEPLGEGGMASVYKAYDTRLERDVAVKVLRTELFGQAMLERILKRFEREA
jgi:hypothetical protein